MAQRCLKCWERIMRFGNPRTIVDLLNILHTRFKGIFTINGVDAFPTLQEMIGRRNVHIHHNGITDQMYLDNFNIYSASSGDYLKINKEYFTK